MMHKYKEKFFKFLKENDCYEDFHEAFQSANKYYWPESNTFKDLDAYLEHTENCFWISMAFDWSESSFSNWGKVSNMWAKKVIDRDLDFE